MNGKKTPQLSAIRAMRPLGLDKVQIESALSRDLLLAHLQSLVRCKPDPSPTIRIGIQVIREDVVLPRGIVAGGGDRHAARFADREAVAPPPSTGKRR